VTALNELETQYETIQSIVAWHWFVIACSIGNFNNESYRLQHSSMAAKSQIKSREHKRRQEKAGKENQQDEGTVVHEPF
jgi:hypothetical protein